MANKFDNIFQYFLKNYPNLPLKRKFNRFQKKATQDHQKRIFEWKLQFAEKNTRRPSTRLFDYSACLNDILIKIMYPCSLA